MIVLQQKLIKIKIRECDFVFKTARQSAQEWNRLQWCHYVKINDYNTRQREEGKCDTNQPSLSILYGCKLAEKMLKEENALTL